MFNPTDFYSAKFCDSVNSVLNLTVYEKDLIKKFGFMVTERLSYNNFIEAFYEIYQKDLPLYFASDAMLHVMHYSFDKAFREIESNYITTILTRLLDTLRSSIPNLESESGNTFYQKAMHDMDLYLTVAENLLTGKTSALYYKDNQAIYDEINNDIKSLGSATIKLFSDSIRKYDFSQFTVRGHYTETQELSNYFRSMMWLGRTEIYITSPEQDTTMISGQSDIDLQRQAILTALICRAANLTDGFMKMDSIENILKVFIGDQDNIRITEVKSLMDSMNITPVSLIYHNTWKEFQSRLTNLASANQMYNSQILYSDPMSPDQVKPSASFMLFGQRPVLDGNITPNVVYDKILYQNQKVLRMLPSTLDVLFSIGNDAAIQLLENEITKYPYSSNLAALRYLIDGYDNTFWQGTCYNNWLDAIRKMNPPYDRSSLPKFMRTAAWQQKNMTTQLASWAELRHDFLLYAKQPYTSGASCSFPVIYVEPVPNTYRALSKFANLALNVTKDIKNIDCSSFFYYFASACNTLAIIADKELINQTMTDDEEIFLSKTLYTHPDCSDDILGWYPSLYYGNYFQVGCFKDKYIVADVHTAPTDADGNEVGWVKHAGTGKFNLAVVVTDLPDGNKYALAGPVMSYYEYTSTNYKRLTDEEWQQAVDTIGMRPDYVNLYLAGKDGGDKGLYSILFTDVPNNPVVEQSIDIINFPNPFNDYTTIAFKIPEQLSNQTVELSICDLSGNIIRHLLNQPMTNGNYTARWNAKDETGRPVPQGIYLFKIKIGDLVKIGKANYMK